MVILPWDRYGDAGVEQQTKLILNNFPLRTYDFYVVPILESGSLKQKDNFGFRKDIKVIPIVVKHSRSTIFSITKAIRKTKPDLILSNLSHLTVVTELARLFSFFDVPIISVNHGTNFNSLKEKIILKFAYIFSSQMIAVSEGLKKDLTSKMRFRPDKIIFIPNALDTDSIINLSQGPIGENQASIKGKKKIIYIGRLEERQKSLFYLLKSFKKIHELNKNVELLMVGDGPDRDLLESFSRENDLDGRIFFLGWQANPYPYLASSDVLVLPSRFEGFGRVLLEALALGVPVVSTNCPSGPSEILADGEYGRLVPIENEKVLVEQLMLTLSSDPDRAKLRQRAKDFSVEKCIKLYENIFSKFI